jgi:cellulose synthase operon protein YhjQ
LGERWAQEKTDQAKKQIRTGHGHTGDSAQGAGSRVLADLDVGPAEAATAARAEVDKLDAARRFAASGASTIRRTEAASSPIPRFSEAGPAWLNPWQTATAVRTADGSGAQSGKHPDQGQVKPQSDLESTLQQSRERVAARWFALKGVFANAEREQIPEHHVPGKSSGQVPILVVYSLAGGVGKTSLVAALGRTLSSLGERVLLADTTSHGLLPFYFGASELHPGVVRTFSPPEGSADAPIQLVSYDADPRGEGEQIAAVDELLGNGRGLNRILIDLNGSGGWLIGRLAQMKPTVLIPLAPDMNSVIGLQMVEKRFSFMLDDQGYPLKPFYLLSQFDAALPLHLDVREVLSQQLGERLLPFVVRRAASVSEALAEGMTIIDYDPESAAARDYLDVAKWIRSVSAPAAAAFRNLRWSER